MALRVAASSSSALKARKLPARTVYVRPDRGLQAKPTLRQVLAGSASMGIDAAEAGSSGHGSVQTVTSRIAELEAQLQDMFKPGKRPPRAAVVSKIRTEVSILTEQLQTFMGSAGYDGPLDDNVARRAFEEVEKAMKAMQFTAKAKSVNEDLLKLEAENSRLRAQARSLLYRQQQLEELLQSATATVQA